MATIGERFKEARKKLGLSRRELGEKLGVNLDVISNIELERLKNPQQKEPLFKLFCKECGINYLWLMEGIGNPISEFPKTIIDDLASTYKLSDESKELVRVFVNLPEDKRKVIIEFFSAIKKDED
ncbi:MAG: helix-turn-helix transcriptional regulator [[Clostridium] spiroforme]|uniref:Helix-turn-helix transcriptional regulator n=1 Tax=Thomasclavelia spiroformis TaxID=29348 RepID=A0A943EPL6_9FIRM|nr:helix-turn-helix transcriptional regulator [Thomasclavelia spiroformis]MBS5588200.1 helix-turn-helix transcriptional regulator [Thomasclavelia spiroformis]